MTQELVRVQLLGLPVAVHARARIHQETLRRELALVDLGPDAGISDRLAALAENHRQRFGAFTEEQQLALQEAEDAGVDTIDLTYDFPVEVAEAAEALLEMLDEVDHLCGRGELVALVTPPEALAYRHWILGEIIGQLRERREPVPWKSFEAEAPEMETHDAGPVAHVAAGGDLDLVGSPALRTAIAEQLEAGARSIVVDLSGCEFIDSVGLSLLLITRERCTALGGGLEVVGAGDSVLSLFETVGIRDLLVRS